VRATYNTVPQPQNKKMSNVVKPTQALDSKRKARAKIGHFLLKIHATYVKLYTSAAAPNQQYNKNVGALFINLSFTYCSRRTPHQIKKFPERAILYKKPQKLDNTSRSGNVNQSAHNQRNVYTMSTKTYITP
jgi:hypothetical protein